MASVAVGAASWQHAQDPNDLSAVCHVGSDTEHWSDEDQVFIAEVPELAGCVAHGDSPEAALAQAQEAITLWLDTAREFGDSIPAPKGRRLQYA